MQIPLNLKYKCHIRQVKEIENMTELTKKMSILIPRTTIMMTMKNLRVYGDEVIRMLQHEVIWDPKQSEIRIWLKEGLVEYLQILTFFMKTENEKTSTRFQKSKVMELLGTNISNHLNTLQRKFDYLKNDWSQENLYKLAKKSNQK